MPLHPSVLDICLRLALTLVASGAIGLDREARRHAAGLRTMILVGLAAAIAMIQANLLLPVDGKTPASFSVLDLMRLPLGILTGVGFIGAGAILKRVDMVSGVTTAATLWLTTVIGLCFGGGQLGLGLGGTGLALLTLFGLRRLEQRWTRVHRAKLIIRAPRGLSETAVPAALASKLCRATFLEQLADHDPERKRLGYDLSWRRRDEPDPPRDVLDLLNGQFEVISFEILTDPAP